MLKKSLLYIVLFLLLFSACKKETRGPKDRTLINAVPIGSTVIIETQSLSKLKEKLYQSKVWNYTHNLTFNSSTENFFKKIAQIVPPKDYDENFMISISLSGGNSYDYLLLKYVSPTEEKEYSDRLKKNYKVSSAVYDQSNLYTLEKDGEKLYYAMHKNIFILSEQKMMVEEGIRQLNKNVSILSNEDFAKLYEETDNTKDVNVFIHYEDLNQLVNNYLQTGQTSWIKHFADWTALEVDFSDNAIDMNGKTTADFIKATYSTIFTGIEPQDKSVLEKLPNSVSALVYTAIGDYPTYTKNYDRYLNKSQILFQKQRNLDRYNAKKSAYMSFQKIVGNQMVTAFISEKEPTKFNQLLLLKTADEATTQNILKTLSQPSPKPYRGYTIQQLSYETLLQDVLGNQAADMTYPYYVIIDDVVVFGNSMETIKGYLNEIILDHYFMKVAENKDFISKFDAKAHAFVMANGAESLQLLKSFLKPDLFNNFNQNAGQLSAINYFGFQTVFKDEIGSTQIKIQFGDNEAHAARQIGSFSLPSKARKIAVVQNHLIQEKEVMVQDAQNRLYLLSKNGTMVFSKELNEPIIGEIQQVDLLKNKRLQYVFNTPTKLYIVDRNGAEVKPFAVTFDGIATAGVGVFDYENNHNYRFAVPVGNRLVMYANNGNRVQGFVFVASSNLVQTPIYHKINDKEYIVTATDQGEILILSRKGEIVVPIKNKFKFKGNLQIIDNKISFVTVDNHVVDIDFSGKITIDDSNLDYTEVKVLPTGIVRMDAKNLEWKGIADIESRLKSEYQYSFEAFAFDKQMYLVAINNTQKEINITNEKNKVLEGMPVFGDGFAKIIKENNSVYLVTQSSDDKSILFYRLQ